MQILIIKTDALGDVVRTSFLAQALKDKYKYQNPQIYWVTSEKATPLFLNNPYVTEVIPSQEKERLKNIKFDLVINIEEDEDNCRFVSSLKSKKLVGAFLNKEGKIDYTSETKYWFNMSRISKFGKKKADILKKQNKKTHRQILSEIIGVDFKKYTPFLRLNKFQRDFADTFLRRHDLSRKELIVGINTGSGERWPKELSVEKTVYLIDKLYKDYNAKILLFGGRNERERNREILKNSKAPVIDTGTGNDLVEFPAIISVCNLFITSDTLGLHVSLALKRKTISLIGPTSHNEIDMYGLGEKVYAKSNCLSCYKENCKSMSKIDLKEIFKSIDRLLNQKIVLLITGFKEPKIGRAIESALNQETHYKYEVLVSAPDYETLEIAKKYAKKDKRVHIFKDPGKGKMFALNVLFKKLDADILILTDGDVFISKKVVEEITNLFLDSEIGCATGRPVTVEDKKTKYGYWANFLFDAANKIRKNAFLNHQFIECSGYLFAFRPDKNIKIPLDTAEDSIIPYYFWERGYKIGYAEKAEVYVKNVNNWKDWVKQKVRTSKAHETLHKYADTATTPRVKSFKTEASGLVDLFKYPKTVKEFYWSILLAFSRLYMWLLVFYNTKIKTFESVDKWERIESTK